MSLLLYRYSMKEIVKPKKFYTVYKITNLFNNKIYIGFHSTNNLDDYYMGSGKLMKKALLKYGVDSFKKEYIQIFDNAEDAVKLEETLVNEEFVLRDDTYNISLGGNVLAMIGKHNPFYGKRHPQEILDRISASLRGKINTAGNAVMFKGDGQRFIGFKRANVYFYPKYNLKFYYASSMFYCGSPDHEIEFEDEKTQIEAIEFYKWRVIKTIENRKNLAISCSERFLGVPKSEETKKRMSESGKGKAHPWNQITNRDPEKIRKMAEKHRGMKRSEESKKRMSEAKKGKVAHGKGKAYCYNPLNHEEKKLCLESEIPTGWIRGMVPKKIKGPKKVFCYDPITLELVLCEEKDIPDGWLRGNPKLWKKERKASV